MKKILFSFALFSMIILFSSCGVNYSLIMNHNINNTQVQLSTNNFKYIDKIKGSSSVSYFLIFGGMDKRQLYETAYSAMLEHANLRDGARAIINVVYEEHVGGVPPFYYTRTVTISGNVIEFTK